MHVHELTYHYPKSNRSVLSGVSFTLQPDKLNVLIGLNGAGKTTLFDCMTDALKPTSGDLSLVPTSDILYLTQHIFYSAELTGKDIAIFIGRLAKLEGFKRKETYEKALTHPREHELLHHLWTMKLGKMSVGERKWLFVTLLASIKRSLYVFDEPTSGVDPASRVHIMRRLQQLVAKGNTCLISTHQLHDLSHIESHVIFLHEGRVLYEGDFHDWLKAFDTTDPDEAFVRMVEEPYQQIAATNTPVNEQRI